ncbi:lytic transglycosylase domain-containing protein [Mucilaginibacter sp.]
MKRLFTITACLCLAFTVKAANRNYATILKGDSDLIVQKPGQFSLMPLQSLHVDYIPKPAANQAHLTAYEGSLTKRRLDSVAKDVQLDYNDYVQKYIDSYTSLNRRDEVSQIIGLSKYYFPIYEKAFRDAGIPEEIKYLSVVESALNPNAVSRVGATGPWQFMFSTAKIYGLNMNNYVDERRDPIQASYAAAAYIKDAYQEFGDWLLAIASYNCGKGAVERAIQQANAVDYWSIRPFLPAETRGYVPAYIAVAYIINYHNRHNITPGTSSLAINTDTVLVNKFVSLPSVARILNIDYNQLSLLNPAYKKHIINGTVKAPRRMVLPQLGKDKFAALYKVLNSDAANAPAEPVYAEVNESSVRMVIPPVPVVAVAEARLPAYHKIKKGETLNSIADKYGVEVDDLIEWNHLRNYKATPGQTLKVTAESRNVSAQNNTVVQPGKSAILYQPTETKL